MRVFGDMWFPGKGNQKLNKTKRLDIFDGPNVETHFCASCGALSNLFADGQLAHG